MNVFRGQMYNLLKAMENNLTPAHLETVSQFIENYYILPILFRKCPTTQKN